MKKAILGLVAILMGAVMIVTPVFADGDCTLTSVIGDSKCKADGTKDKDGEYNCICDDGNGSGVEYVLNMVVDILTVGVGVLGVLGVTVVGIQYLTAGGSEEKTRKAKSRMTEIIIGLAIYAVFYAILKWLNVAPQ